MWISAPLTVFHPHFGSPRQSAPLGCCLPGAPRWQLSSGQSLISFLLVNDQVSAGRGKQPQMLWGHLGSPSACIELYDNKLQMALFSLDLRSPLICICILTPLNLNVRPPSSDPQLLVWAPWGSFSCSPGPNPSDRISGYEILSFSKVQLI